MPLPLITGSGTPVADGSFIHGLTLVVKNFYFEFRLPKVADMAYPCTSQHFISQS